MRGVNLRHNKIGEAGILALVHATHCNNNLLMMDVRENHPCYTKKKFNDKIRDELLFNLRALILSYVERSGIV
jgi:hypothetical protein